MPKHSNASDFSPEHRDAVSRELYLNRGAAEASERCNTNSRFGTLNLAEEILTRMRVRPRQTIVDVGCGAGQHLAHFAAAQGPGGRLALGLDFSFDALRRVHAAGLMAAAACGDRLPLRSGCADVVTCNFAIYYFPSPATALAEFFRVLKPEGRLVISGPAVGNNLELYDFHNEVTGIHASDVDLMALGFIENEVQPAVTRAGFSEVSLDLVLNSIRFPGVDAFLDYWTGTSLFIRTPGTRRVQGEAWFQSRGHEGEVTVTKRVAILSAVRP